MDTGKELNNFAQRAQSAPDADYLLRLPSSFETGSEFKMNPALVGQSPEK